ncbi:MAG: VOC family protein [Pseudomonadota bacterium]
MSEHNFISCAAVLVVDDIHRSVGFYRDRLGFVVREIHGDPLSFAIADAPTASIILKEGGPNARPHPNGEAISGLWDAYIWVRDLRALTEDLAARGARMEEQVEQPYGCTEVVVRDPDGYAICFGYCP